MKTHNFILIILLVLAWCPRADAYENFSVAVYCRAYETRQMADLNWLDSRWQDITKQVHVDKVYLETHRDLLIVDYETLNKAKAYFHERGIRTAGGITLTVNERNRFETFCYSNPEHRKKVKEIVEHTARHFDEIILDDFYFTSCKCKLSIAAKGDKTWTQYRLDLLAEAAKSLIIDPAKAVNPKVKVVIKYPNWYEHFQGLGFNLEKEPALFDGLYTGTETRDPSGNQHLQPYLGYLIFRYFENLKRGGNDGGWVDTGGLRFMDRYAEQLWLTLFAKAPEITLFDIRQIVRPIDSNLRADWQDGKTSFSFDAMTAPITMPDGSAFKPNMIARAAGVTFEQVDRFVGKLGKPVGIKSYKPYHSTGEDFLHNYLGMCGVPMDLVPEFPTDVNMVFLTETAKFDPDLIAKIKAHLMQGKQVMITSGLLRALQGGRIEEIVEMQVTNRKAVVRDFRAGWGRPVQARAEMVIPQIQYLTNDSWEEISALDQTNGWPMLHSASYGGGTLYVLTVPESFTDLYNLPAEVLNRIRQTLCRDLVVRLEGPGKVSLFVYDNDTFIVESFLDEPVEVQVVTDDRLTTLTDLVTGQTVTAGSAPQDPRGRIPGRRFEIALPPHSYRVFRGQQ
jgi:hypothetical protein